MIEERISRQRSLRGPTRNVVEGSGDGRREAVGW